MLRHHQLAEGDRVRRVTQGKRSGELGASSREGGDDDELLRQLGGGAAARQRAVVRLYERYGKPFCRYFRRHGLSVEAAEDLMQDCFVKILRSIDSFRGDGPLEAWLWTIARNSLIGHLRGTPATTSLDDFDEGALEALAPLHAGAPVDPAQADCVRRGFERFMREAPLCADAITRLVVDGWGYAEVAAWRRSSQGAAREYLSQCRKRLALLVEPCFVAGQTA